MVVGTRASTAGSQPETSGPAGPAPPSPPPDPQEVANPVENPEGQARFAAELPSLIRQTCSVLDATSREEILRIMEVHRRNTTALTDDVIARLGRMEAITGPHIRDLPKEIATIRRDLNELMEARTSLQQEMDLRFARAANRLNRLENVNPEGLEPLGERSVSSRKTRKSRPETDESSEGSDYDPKGNRTDDESQLSSSESEYGSRRRRKDSRHRHHASSSKSYSSMVSIHRRKPGPRFETLREIVPTNPLYKKVMSYRTYRLARRDQDRSSRETGKVRDFIKRMDIKLSAHHFSGEDPIMVLDFLARFTREANIQEMSEAQAFLTLPSFLSGMARLQFEAGTELEDADGEGVTCWPEAVQYLLRNYAMSNHISAAVNDLRSIKQGRSETEQEFANRLSKGLARCGNVYPKDEVVAMFVDGLRTSLSPLIADYMERKPSSTFLQLIHHAQRIGESQRAQGKDLGRSTEASPLVEASRGRRTVAFADVGGAPSSSSSGMREENRGTGTNVHMLSEGAALSSSTGSHVPSESVAEDSMLIMPHRRGNPQGYRTVPAPPLAYAPQSMMRSRPGWVEQQPSGLRRSNSFQTVDKVGHTICYTCYRPGHISTECDLPAKDLKLALVNYERLTEAERAAVPSDAYERTRKALGIPEGRNNDQPRGMQNPEVGGQRGTQAPPVERQPGN